jgi:hypothetical protein
LPIATLVLHSKLWRIQFDTRSLALPLDMASNVIGQSPFSSTTASKLNTLLQRSQASAMLPQADHSISDANQDGVQYIIEDHRLLEELFDIVR